jgi:hypothetical protein
VLFWEPRRLRVHIAKLLALIAVAALVAVALQAWALGLAAGVSSLRGSGTRHVGDVWRDVAGTSLRAAGVGSFAAVMAYSVAGLIRNTGGALGAAFVYFAVLEHAIFALRPGLGSYLMSTNLATWVNGHSLRVEGVHLTPTRAGLTLLVYGVVLAAAAGTSFVTRDVT